MRAGVVLALCIVCIGCRQQIPGDGRPVLVTVDESLASLPVQVVRADGTQASATLMPYVARGVRYWDAVGARLRVADDWLPGDGIAAELRIVPASALDHALDGAPAFYSELDGAVHVDLAQLRARGGIYFPEVELRALFAHEAGHALGLDHVPHCKGVMAQHCWLDGLTSVDVAQFEERNGR
jgi:hypothetical protein